jgi:hypothetical protein
MQQLFHEPGTWTILRTLFWQTRRDRLPVHHYALQFRKVRRKRAGPLLYRLRWLLRIVVIALGSMFGIVLILSGPKLIAISVIAAYLLLLLIQGIGTVVLVMLGWFWPVWVINDTARIISTLRNRGIWADFLLLPHDRTLIVLHSLGIRAISLEALIWLLATESLGVVLGANLLRWLVLLAAILVEWLQLVALSIVIGISISTYTRRPLLYALASGVGIVLLRALSVGILSVIFPVRGNLLILDLLVGPPTILCLSLPLGIVLVAVYLLVLEIMVRRIFAWGIMRLGEGSES